MLYVLKTFETADLHCSVIKKLADEITVPLVVITEELARVGRQANIQFKEMGMGKKKPENNRLTSLTSGSRKILEELFKLFLKTQKETEK